MGDMSEKQQEELEVLQSIYEGDTKFKQISSICFQYMYGDEEQKSILIEISWPELYPSVLPSVNLDLFHNGYLTPEFKSEIQSKILKEANDLLHDAMTYSLFNWMSEHADDFINRIAEIVANNKVFRETKLICDDNSIVSTKKEKKQQLSKAQKRRITEQTNYLGEKERGHDWIDVVKHLTQGV
ncbi:RWD domain-containing protein 4 [Hydra vulgaris]|uniref:RWD domain-containing protein 4 n=1 Tax=Hydra vulgaris TaxID=6087 RepID=A0ABM4CN15_HYDVU